LSSALAVSVAVHVAVIAAAVRARPPDPVKPKTRIAPQKLETVRVTVLPVPHRGPFDSAALRSAGRGEGRSQPLTVPVRAKPRPTAVEAPARAEEETSEIQALTPDEAATEPEDSSVAFITDVPLTPPERSGAESTGLSPREEGRSFDVKALHAALAEAARRCYPAAARRYRLSGEAQIDFCLDGSGALSSTRLVASSGAEVLDAAARDCVIAGALPLPREAVGGCYTVPVRFSTR
jgi:TonB family protein